MYAYNKPVETVSLCASGRAAAEPLVRFGRDFCMETSIHGLRHIAEPRRHWMERLLWACAVCFALWGAANVSLGQLQRFQDSPTVVTLEKDFRSWRYSLPAVTVCLKNRVDPQKVVEVIKSYWNTEPSEEGYEYYSGFVHLAANSDLLNLEGFRNYSDTQLDVDLYQLVLDVMPKLEDMQVRSSESVRFFKWTPVMTESGICHSTNSLAVDDIAIVKAGLNDTKVFPMTCKHSALNCYFMIETSYDTYINLHSPYDVADITTPATRLYKGLNLNKEMGVMETGCGKGVKVLKPKRRGCRYTDEPTAEGRKIYSTNTCRLSCRSKLALKECGCRPFYYFYEGGSQCSVAGMACLAGFRSQLANIACDCIPQCEYSVFSAIGRDDPISWTSGVFASKGVVKYSMKAPRTRYTREIVFHFQDLVVSFGGAAGLFLGASFISLVEMLYFFLTRLFRSINVVTSRAYDKKMAFEMKQILTLTALLEQEQDKQKKNYEYYFLTK